jgi:phage shock protein A
MKEKIDQDEAIADAYGEMSLESRSVDDEIESALASETSSQSDSLLALKARLSANSERKMLGE